jgi:arsenate reductase
VLSEHHNSFGKKSIYMVKIFHNPNCGTSRNTLALIRNSGVEPEVVLYLETPPSKAQLKKLIEDMSIPVRDVLRKKGTPYEELDLGNAKWSDDDLLNFMMVHPILINRPIVVTSIGTKLCRPSEVVIDILVDPQRGAFTKEDGEVVINEKGLRA